MRLFLTVLLFLASGTAAALTPSEHRCVTSTVYGEARGESEIGQALVAQTVLNRMRDPRWPDTVCGVTAQRMQFEGYNSAAPRNAIDREAWRLAEAIVDAVARDHFRVGSCSRATHFHSTAVNPRWNRQMRRLCRVDNHIFYEDRT